MFPMISINGDVIKRLSQLGFNSENNASSDSAVTYAIDRAAEKIKANINRTDIPEELYYTWVDISAGLFLLDKKATGQLGEGFDFTSPAKRVTEGDVSVEFAGASDGSSTPEERFDKLLNSLINPPAYLFARFRRFVW